MHVAIESLQDSRMTTSKGVGRLEAYPRPAPVAPGKARLSTAHGGRPSWVGPFPLTAYASTALRVKRPQHTTAPFNSRHQPLLLLSAPAVVRKQAERARHGGRKAW
ncbi:hypothetical protein BN1708_017269, partial [Verticillium longisporum]